MINEVLARAHGQCQQAQQCARGQAEEVELGYRADCDDCAEARCQSQRQPTAEAAREAVEEHC